MKGNLASIAEPAERRIADAIIYAQARQGVSLK